MGSRFIRLTNEETIWIKKHIKISEATFENILRNILAYHALRKKEAILKSKLKNSLIQLKSKINQMELNFPEQERKDSYEIIYEKEKGKKHHTNIIHNHELEEHHIPHHLATLHRQLKREQNRSVDEELDDIKRKLEKLQK